jgi:hypothetical protein
MATVGLSRLIGTAQRQGLRLPGCGFWAGVARVLAGIVAQLGTNRVTMKIGSAVVRGAARSGGAAETLTCAFDAPRCGAD